MHTDYQNYDENELAGPLDKYATPGSPECDTASRAMRPSRCAEQNADGVKDEHDGKETVYYWIAINRSSCAMCTVPMSGVPGVSPRPQGLIGFPTFAAAKAAQKLCLTAPIHSVKKAVIGWRAGNGGVRFVEYKNPQRPQAQTHWILSKG
jgi:hypothetical protein